MKSSVLLHLHTEDEARYQDLTRQMYSFLHGHTRLVQFSIDNYDVQVNDPKLSSYIIGHLGPAIVDFSSHLRDPVKFQRGDIWTTVISANPKEVSGLLSGMLGHQFDYESLDGTEEFERDERAWRLTLLDYSPMPDMLKLIWTTQELAEAAETLRREYNQPEAWEYPEMLFHSIKESFLQTLDKILLEETLRQFSKHSS